MTHAGTGGPGSRHVRSLNASCSAWRFRSFRKARFRAFSRLGLVLPWPCRRGGVQAHSGPLSASCWPGVPGGRVAPSPAVAGALLRLAVGVRVRRSRGPLPVPGRGQQDGAAALSAVRAGGWRPFAEPARGLRVVAAAGPGPRRQRGGEALTVRVWPASGLCGWWRQMGLLSRALTGRLAALGA